MVYLSLGSGKIFVTMVPWTAHVASPVHGGPCWRQPEEFPGPATGNKATGGLFNQKLLLGKNNRPPEWDCSTCQVRCNSESSISGSLQKKHRAHADAEGIEFLQALQFAAQKCLLTIKLAISIVKQNSVAVDWEA
jgi:hypothetical protein